MLRYLTAGESHGRALLAILEGLPAGLRIEERKINEQLQRRQLGYGRSSRMKMEKDRVMILCGLRKNLTIAAPIGLLIKNKDFSIEKLPQVFSPRPGHADLAGILKYGFFDARSVLERASARETAARTAIGAICKIFLGEFKIRVQSKVISICGERKPEDIHEIIDEARRSKDTVGGILEVCAKNVPAGLGSYAQADRRLEARLTGAIMSIPGIKAVEIGLGFGYADKFGSCVHDAIYYSKNKGFDRKGNNAGGIEGGLSNGEDIILRVCMKPISTLMHPLDSVNITSKKPSKAAVERSDICVVEAAGVVAEAVVGFELARAFLEKFGSDNLADIKENYKNYLKRIYVRKSPPVRLL